MHYFHRVVVAAEDEEEAISEAESAISNYGDGHVWDWYSIGGRWENQLNGKNAISYREDPEEFKRQVEAAHRNQEQEFQRYRRMVTGEPYTKEEVPEDVGSDLEKVGSAEDPTGAVKWWLDRSNESLARNHAEVRSVLEARTLTEAQVSDLGMGSFYLKKFASLASGEYSSCSYFFDAINYEGSTKWVREKIEENDEEALDQLWMVGIDMHN